MSSRWYCSEIKEKPVVLDAAQFFKLELAPCLSGSDHADL